MKTPYAEKVERYCSQHSMELAEYLLVAAIADYFPMSRDRLLSSTACEVGQGWFSSNFPDFHCDDWETHCNALLKKDLLAEIDADYLKSIAGYLQEKPALGPIMGLPENGDLELTLKGAALWKESEESQYGWTATNPRPIGCRFDKTPSLVQLFGTDREFLSRFLEDLLESETDFSGDVISISDPVAIGMWRSRWWETFDNGWMIEVELTPEDD
jgi:hypothetical protein